MSPILLNFPYQVGRTKPGEKRVGCGAKLVIKKLSVFINPPENHSEKIVKFFIALPVFLALISLLDVGFLSESVLAQQGFKWGRMEIHPGVAFEAKYDDNIFLDADKTFVDGTSETAEEDFIFITALSLTIEQKRQKGDNFGFFFKYSGEDERFVDLNEQNFFSQNVSAHLELGDVGGDMNLILGGGFMDTRTPISVEFASNLNPRIDRTTYDLESNLLWKLTHDIEADIGAQFSRNLFDDFDLEEFDQYNGSGTLIWQATALTGIGVNYSNQYVDYLETSTDNFDNFMYSGSFILKWKPLSVFSSEFWIGFSQLNVFGVAGQDRDDMIYKIQLEYEPKSTRSWTLTGYREISNSYFRDIQAFQRTVAQLNLDQKIGVKWDLKSQISFQVNKYDLPAADISGGGTIKLRKDEFFSGLLSLTYSIQDWLAVIMEYSYTINDSNFDDHDYSENLVFLRFSFVL